jgi:hypothetical protein
MHRPLPSRHTPCAVRSAFIPFPVSFSMNIPRKSTAAKRHQQVKGVFSGYTLVEILVATVLSLLLLGAVVQMFGTVGRTITESRSMLEATDRLRSAVTLMQKDLEGITVSPSNLGLVPPVRPEDGQGYVEIIEGPIIETRSGVHPNILHNTTNPPPPSPYPIPIDRDRQPAASRIQVRFNDNGQMTTYDVDTSAGDFDDILMFTTRSKGKPFIGRCDSMPGRVIQSDVAEVCWFIRGRTLYRRVLVVAPEAPAVTAPHYAHSDVSAHYDFAHPALNQLVGNTLSDLTRRECRFAHPIYWDNFTTPQAPILFPCDVRDWGYLRLPTLLETSFPLWTAANFPAGLRTLVPPLPNTMVQWNSFDRPWMPIPPPYPTPAPPVMNPLTTDFWRNLPVRDPEHIIRKGLTYTDPTHPNNPNNVNVRFSSPTFMLYDTTKIPSDRVQTDTMFQSTLRYSDDVILENVIGFDVKVWDSAAPLYLVYVFKNNNNTPNVAEDDFTDYVLDPKNLPSYASGTLPVLMPLNDFPYVPNVGGYAQGRLDAISFNNITPAGYGAYVDLGYGGRFGMPGISTFSGLGMTMSGLYASDLTQARVYDTWSSHYENAIYNPNSNLKTATPNQPDPNNTGLVPGRGSNGFDDDLPGNPGYGIVDDAGEIHVPPPYPAPLRGIQVKIRVFEPDSRQIREMTVIQDFLPR